MKKLTALLMLVSIPAFSECLTSDDEIGRANCAIEAQKTSEKSLSRAYSKALTELDPSVRVHLIKAQKMWWTLKEFECDAVSEGGLGTATVVNGAFCRASKSKSRALELQDLYGLDL